MHSSGPEDGRRGRITRSLTPAATPEVRSERVRRGRGWRSAALLTHGSRQGTTPTHFAHLLRGRATQRASRKRCSSSKSTKRGKRLWPRIATPVQPAGRSLVIRRMPHNLRPAPCRAAALLIAHECMLRRRPPTDRRAARAAAVLSVQNQSQLPPAQSPVLPLQHRRQRRCRGPARRRIHCKQRV